jgi:hypothetical protein
MRKIFVSIVLFLCALGLGAQVQPHPPGSGQITGVSGNGHTLATVSGPLTQGDGVTLDAFGNLIDTGSPAGTGGTGSGTVNAGTSGHCTIYLSSTAAVSSDPNCDSGVTTANVRTFGDTAGVAAKKFTSTDTVNNSATTYATGSGGDSTCPAPLAGTSYLCSKSSVIYASLNGAAYTPIAGAITPTSMIASGIADGQAAMTVTTGASATLGGTYSAGYTVNENATAATAVTYTLPTAVAGKQYCVANGYNGSAANTGTLEILTSASGQFIIFADGTLSATGGFVISGGAAGDKACVVGVDSTHWLLYVQAGTWTKH